MWDLISNNSDINIYFQTSKRRLIAIKCEIILINLKKRGKIEEACRRWRLRYSVRCWMINTDFRVEFWTELYSQGRYRRASWKQWRILARQELRVSSLNSKYPSKKYNLVYSTKLFKFLYISLSKEKMFYHKYLHFLNSIVS